MLKSVKGIFLVLSLGACASTPIQEQQVKAKPAAQEIEATKPASVITERKSFASMPAVPQYVVNRIGNLVDPRAKEVSGLAVSNRNRNRLWMINDSGNSAELMAFDTQGRHSASFATTLVNRDWESLSSFSIGDKDYLLVADSGDNLKVHPHYTLALFLEPDDDMVLHSFRVGSAGQRVLSPILTTKFVYPDGKHNSEAIAVSIVDRKIIIVTKGSGNAGVYSLPLQVNPEAATRGKTVTATRLGTLSNPSQSLGDRLIGQLAGVDLSQATGLEISSDGNIAFMLTYRGIYGWVRQSVEDTWGDVMANPAQLLSRHSLAQAEALALSKITGQLYVVSENLPSPILELTPAEGSADKAGLL